MEALAAVGLASNIVQFIGFARELVSTSKQISRSADGTLVEILEIEAIAKNLQNLSDNLRVVPAKKDGRVMENYTPSKEEESLKQLCEGCRFVAGLMIEKIKGLTVDTKVSRKAGRKLKTSLAKEDMEDLETRLDRYQTTLNYKHHTPGLPQLVNGAQIDREILIQQRIHSLLQFEEIADRHEYIAEAHKRTFEWVFHQGRPQIHLQSDLYDQKTPELAPRWDDFQNWLQGGNNMYWITGKPGSGKSTPMKFLFNEPRTTASAIQWGGNNELIELISALKMLISMKQFNFLLFIDGLDEFDGDPQDLVSLVEVLTKIAPMHVKLCVASRPWLVFEESFKGMPWLRMEDLTRRDIQLYVDENMSESPRWNELHQFMPKEASKMIDEITDRAVGVSLWVILVVASFLSGLRDGDSIEDLWKRINELPSTLEELFQKILGDLNPRYFTQGCEMFQLAFTAFTPPTLLDMSLALDGPVSAISAPVGQMSETELKFRGETMRRQVISRSKGLLEVPAAEFLGVRAKMEYLHRTVRDFLKSVQSWAYIRSGAPDFDPPLMLSASFLRRVKMVKVADRAVTWDDFWLNFTYSLEYIRKRNESDELDANPSIRILDALREAGDAFWYQKPLHPTRYRTWLEELVDGSNTRTVLPDWREIMVQAPVDSASQPETTYDHTQHRMVVRRRKQIPHWTNTLHLAETDKLRTPQNPQNETRSFHLSCFFDFAFILQFSSYVCATMSPEHARKPSIGAGPPLERAVIMTRDFPVAHRLLGLGADPNVKRRASNETVWQNILRHARLEHQQGDQELCNLAIAFARHGADLDPILSEDFNTVFSGMDKDEKNALFAKVSAAHRARKGAPKESNAGRSEFSIKAVKHKFRLSSLFKKEK
ncbi:hypothetical protein DM02DRAFT_726796 [Periconia macrospinosa]|uniref:NACHT domain-containing protein n=1 Tax=Periconia macrospinosa TaxID=97972 RepID=A0A2V1E0L9_9PLEO|nr:hypothetical protein DM02DRAFT_726796 [Periconia macrospinosa]